MLQFPFVYLFHMTLVTPIVMVCMNHVRCFTSLVSKRSKGLVKFFFPNCRGRRHSSEEAFAEQDIAQEVSDMNMNSQNELNAYNNEVFEATGETALYNLEEKEKPPFPPDYYNGGYLNDTGDDPGPLPVKPHV